MPSKFSKARTDPCSARGLGSSLRYTKRLRGTGTGAAYCGCQDRWVVAAMHARRVHQIPQSALEKSRALARAQAGWRWVELSHNHGAPIFQSEDVAQLLRSVEFARVTAPTRSGSLRYLWITAVRHHRAKGFPFRCACFVRHGVSGDRDQSRQRKGLERAPEKENPWHP
jgi:hypothetical protein